MQHGESVFIYGIEVQPDEENGGCVPYSVGDFLDSKIPKFIVYIDLTEIGSY